MINDEALREFLVESHENLDRLDQDFVALEENPTASERISAIFRTIHTIKGTAGFLGFSRLESLTHAGENLLSRMRDGRIVLNGEITTALLALVDAVRKILRAVEHNGRESEDDNSALIAKLHALTDGHAPAAPAEAQAAPSAPETEPVATAETPAADKKRGRAKSAAKPAAATEAEDATTPVAVVAATPESIAAPIVAEAVVAPAPAATPAAAPAAAAAASADAGDGAGSISDSTVRVAVGLLDKLMNLVGELVLARNQILQCSSRIEDPTFLSTTQRLNLITTELQAEVMKTRMQPIGNVWSKLPRVVRDLAVVCGKQVRVEMFGKDTELDRTVLEAIKDPLTHIVRNAVDHGIEAADDRSAAGKPRTGTLILRAFHEGGQVNVEINDDGQGLNTTRIRAKAIERGLVSAERAAQMSERELQQMIFLPGFSTAAKVTNVSGRGVGMDVVKTNIERIGGTVEMHSSTGRGSTIRIKIPLTLAIVPALVVASGGSRYAIPQVNLLELVRLEGDQVATGVESIRGTKVYRLRGNLLPLVHLNDVLRLKSAAAEASDEREQAVNIVVLQADDRQFGLVVDEVRDTEEIVVKPLGKELMGIPAFAGATIMGDGRVALILDIMSLAQYAGVIKDARDQGLLDQSDTKGSAAIKEHDAQTLLLFRIGENDAMAVQLNEVARLEEFPINRVERTGHQRVVQYRGGILPLINLSDYVEGVAGDDRDSLQVVVYANGARQVGVVVGTILDIVEQTISITRRVSRPGVLGAAVIQGRVTDLVDLSAIVGGQGDHYGEEAA